MFRTRFCLSKQSLIILVPCAIVFLSTTSLYSFNPYPFEVAEKGKAKEALKTYEDEAIKHESEGKLVKAATAYLDATWLARAAGNYHKAILYGTKAIELSEKGKYPELQVEALYQTAESYAAIADYETAIRLLEKSAEIESTSKYELQGEKANLNMEIGDIYRKLSVPEEALKYYKKVNDYYMPIFGTSLKMTCHQKKKELTPLCLIKPLMIVLAATPGIT